MLRIRLRPLSRADFLFRQSERKQLDFKLFLNRGERVSLSNCLREFSLRCGLK